MCIYLKRVHIMCVNACIYVCVFIYLLPKCVRASLSQGQVATPARSSSEELAKKTFR